MYILPPYPVHWSVGEYYVPFEAEISIQIGSGTKSEIRKIDICPFTDCNQSLGTRDDALFAGLTTSKETWLNHLRKLLPDSTPDPGYPSNCNGLKVKSQRLHSEKLHLSCQQHRYDSDDLPRALALKWPRPATYSLEALLPRLEKDTMKEFVLKLVQDPSRSYLWEHASLPKDHIRPNELKKLTPRTWPLTDHAYMKGTLGYYGARGYFLVRVFLRRLVPSNPANDDIVEKIVMPEVAVRLIREDSDNCSLELGMALYRESSEYGLREFPDNVEDDPLEPIFRRG